MSGKDPVPQAQSYQGVRATNPPNIIKSLRAPTANDIKYPIGTMWINTTTSTSYQLVTAPGIWSVLGSGTTGAVQSLTASSGGGIVPTAGNINILGTANQVTTAGAGSTITLSLPAAIIAPGSLTTTTTLASGTTLTAGTSMSAGTSITAGTTLTATLGNITATNGNLVFGTAGNKIVSTSIATTTTAGANSFGTVTLSGGTATVSTTAIGTNSKVILTRQTVGATGAAALGHLSVGTIVNGTSFVINAWSATDATALAATDVSNIYWQIIN